MDLSVLANVLEPSALDIDQRRDIRAFAGDISHDLVVPTVPVFVDPASPRKWVLVAPAWMIRVENHSCGSEAHGALNDLQEVRMERGWADSRQSAVSLPIVAVIHSELHQENFWRELLDVIRDAFKAEPCRVPV